MTDQSKPIVATKSPSMVDLEAGKEYFWCSCGRSKSQPFCDGSHAGTGINPMSFKASESGTAALCQCKATANKPFCDGTHASLGEIAVGSPAPEPTSDIPNANIDARGANGCLHP